MTQVDTAQGALTPQGSPAPMNQEVCVWRVTQVATGQPNTVALRIQADSAQAQALLGEIDTWGHKPVRVIDRERVSHRDPASGGYPTTSVTLLLTQ